MGDTVLCVCGGVNHKKRISGSSCEAEIKAIDNDAKAVQFLRHLSKQLGLVDRESPIPVLNYITKDQ